MGWLYVADLHNNRVQCFDAERVFRAVTGSGTRAWGLTLTPLQLEEAEA